MRVREAWVRDIGSASGLLPAPGTKTRYSSKLGSGAGLQFCKAASSWHAAIGSHMTRSKNRALTEQRILTAINQLLAAEGYKALGINRVAKQAGIDKVLIYRYFGGLEGALKAWAETEDFWPRSDEIIGMSRKDFAELDYLSQRKTLTINTLRAMRKRPQTLSILAWEMVENNELTRILAEQRARQNAELHDLLKPSGRASDGAMDTDVIELVLAAAVHYLAMTALTGRPVFGMRTEISWERIEHSLAFIHDGIDLAEQRKALPSL